MLVTGAPGRKGLAEGRGRQACNTKEQSKPMRREFRPSPCSALHCRVDQGDAGCPALTCVEGKVQQRK